MKEKIINYLKEIEEQKEIEILLACETGSRAWGFPSPDSDYDVRFIYRHKLDWYLSLNEKKDTIEKMLDDNEIDISGWDIKKSLKLLVKSNPPLLERIQSPIIYIAKPNFISNINDLAKNTYSKIATMYHYLSMAKKMHFEVKENNEVKLKKLFYALRTSIACLWILEKDVMPPIVFQVMLQNIEIAPSIIQQINELIEIKSTKNESFFINQQPDLNLFIESIIKRASAEALNLPSSIVKMDEMNEFFRKSLHN